MIGKVNLCVNLFRRAKACSKAVEKMQSWSPVAFSVLLLLLVGCGVAVPENNPADAADAPESLAAADNTIVDEAAPLVVNPELMAFQRYQAAIANSRTESANLAANPELMAFHRYKAPIAGDKSGAAFLSANPELMAFHRYTAAMSNKVKNSTWFAANPELMAVQRYIVEK